MTAKTMAEVIHQRHCLERVHNEDCMFWQEDHESAAALSDAGFGLVTDTKAEGARAAVAYLREGMGPWAEPRVLGFLEGAHSVAAHIVEDS